MPFVVAFPAFSEIQRVGLVNVMPYRGCVALPNVDARCATVFVWDLGNSAIVALVLCKIAHQLVTDKMRELAFNWPFVFAGFAHDNQIIRNALA